MSSIFYRDRAEGVFVVQNKFKMRIDLLLNNRTRITFSFN